MQDTLKVGMNRTGIQISPFLTSEMIRDTEKFPASPETAEDLEALRSSYLKESSAVGTIPISGKMFTAVKGFGSEALLLFFNKLGERLAFERTGARLYEALLLKCRESSRADLPTERLQEIHQQEIEHFQLLKNTMEKLGADPTSQTPDSDVCGVAAAGWIQVVFDPRTSVAQTLTVMQTAELADNAGWELLIALAEKVGVSDQVSRFKEAAEHEAQHLQTITDLIQAITLEGQNVQPSENSPSRPPEA
jgi:rubrerythrin